ncbi:MAG: YwqG family protein [Candidatus Thermoplasmatota archaeon]|nr:YwqG family protein [Candidatus Thermoplasmatota archaeon]
MDDYEKLESAVIGDDFLDYVTQVRGCPQWMQGNETPLNSSGKRMKLLLQISSEDDANLMWGDVGLVYIFYDPDSPGTFEYVRQEG